MPPFDQRREVFLSTSLIEYGVGPQKARVPSLSRRRGWFTAELQYGRRRQGWASALVHRRSRAPCFRPRFFPPFVPKSPMRWKKQQAALFPGRASVRFLGDTAEAAGIWRQRPLRQRQDAGRLHRCEHAQGLGGARRDSVSGPEFYPLSH